MNTLRVRREMRFLHNFKVFSHKILITKGKSNLTKERPGRQHLNRVTEVNLTRNGTSHTIAILCYSCSKMHNLNLIKRNKINPKWGALTNKWSMFFKSIKAIWRSQEDWATVPRVKETEEMTKLNAMWDSEQDLFAAQTLPGRLAKTWMVSED